MFYEVIGGGHSWPSSSLAAPDSRVADRLAEIQGYTTFEIDATADGWAFLSGHALED